MKTHYFPRIVDAQVQQCMAIMGAVVIEGPKWCGKTTTAEQFAKSNLYLADPDKINEYRIVGDVSPKILLEGEKPRLIDEWQVAPKLWDAIRFDVDHSKEFGQYLLTGSSSPRDKKNIFHTGTGRFSWVKMRPMSLYESGDSSGSVSLAELFSTPKTINGKSKVASFEDMAYLTCRGGWPRISVIKDKDASLRVAYEYVNGVVKTDPDNEGEENAPKKTERLRRLLRSLARNQGTQASMETILEDMGSGFSSPKTLKSDLDNLTRLFVTEDSMAWNPNLRSQTAIRTSDTRYFVDPSIAVASLGLGPGDLAADVNTFGFLFETLVIRDLRIYADVLNGNVYHYRDKSGSECDAVIHLRNGNYGLVEIKIGGDNLINEGVERLITLRENLDTTKMKEPSFMAVVTGTGEYAYRRPEDGIYIVPIGCLKP